MATIQVDILNPKAEKLLRDLADLKLIFIKESVESDFITVVKKIREQAASSSFTIEEISEEVEAVRGKRYGQKRK